jgi:hypothetical protein
MNCTMLLLAAICQMYLQFTSNGFDSIPVLGTLATFQVAFFMPKQARLFNRKNYFLNV